VLDHGSDEIAEGEIQQQEEISDHSFLAVRSLFLVKSCIFDQKLEVKEAVLEKFGYERIYRCFEHKLLI